MKFNYTLERLTDKRGKRYIKRNHYSGGCSNAAMIWGLFKEGELCGAIAFATPISENVRSSIFGEEYKNHVTELHRLHTKDFLPHGTETHFISRALNRLKEYKPKYWAVVSFADATEGHIGTVYQASSAIYYGKTKEVYFYRDKDDRLRPPRQNGKNITKQEARKMGWSIEKRESKYRYLFLTPDNKRHNRMLKEKLKITPQEYPKEKVKTNEVNENIDNNNYLKSSPIQDFI